MKLVFSYECINSVKPVCLKTKLICFECHKCIHSLVYGMIEGNNYNQNHAVKKECNVAVLLCQLLWCVHCKGKNGKRNIFS